jgi:thymidylate synthase (FAD)
VAVSLVTTTPEAEKLLAYMARVSSSHQDNPEYSKLLRYLIEHQHWSPFEMVHMVVEIETSRAIAAQILRHRSFSFQEFSQRYAEVPNSGPPSLLVGRMQSEKNRQSSGRELPEKCQEHWLRLQETIFQVTREAYCSALDSGVAKEQARMLLPLATPTRLYMAGSVRSWIHYLHLRTQEDTQKEHRDIALAVQRIFIQQFPCTSEALGWSLQKSEFDATLDTVIAEHSDALANLVEGD